MRVFIALLFSETEKKKIFKQLKNLTNNYQGNYTTYNNLHLTLYYIGEIDSLILEKVINCVKKINFSKFKYETIGLDCFKNRQKDCLVHLKVKNNLNLKQLHDEVIIKLKDIGIKVFNQKFTPHITLGRKVKINQNDLKQITSKPIIFNANKISIMESKRINGDLVYREIDYSMLK